MSPRSTTLPLYFRYWGSSWDDRSPLTTQSVRFYPHSLLQRSPTSFLFLTFVSCHAGIFSYFPIPSPLLPLLLVFHGLRHRNKFVHYIVATEWIYSFRCNMILMIPTRSSFQSNSRGLVSFHNTSMFCLTFPNTAVGFPTVVYWCFARHCCWYRNFQLPTSVFLMMFLKSSSSGQWSKHQVIFWHYRGLVSR